QQHRDGDGIVAVVHHSRHVRAPFAFDTLECGAVDVWRLVEDHFAEGPPIVRIVGSPAAQRNADTAAVHEAERERLIGGPEVGRRHDRIGWPGPNGDPVNGLECQRAGEGEREGSGAADEVSHGRHSSVRLLRYAMNLAPLRRRVRRAARGVRETRMLIRAFQSAYRPVAAHLTPVRRCNLSCTYCNEFDDHSAPVATGDVLRRVDRLAELGTGIVTLSGGEPLLHPDLDEIVRRIRRHGAIATLITNGYLLSRDRIRRLNRAGLDHLQISIDNVMPDDVSKKSLKLLDQKLRWLAEYAEFDVTVNSVV